MAKTSKKAASAASKVLKDGRTGKASKTAAGSALSQKKGPSSGRTHAIGGSIDDRIPPPPPKK